MSPLCKVLIGLDNFLYAETLQGGLSICKETQISGPQRRFKISTINSNIRLQIFESSQTFRPVVTKADLFPAPSCEDWLWL